ncbi:MAG: methylaspartate mutase accessory protein GlmL, partial [Candidatus Binatia bacterium]
MDSLAILIDFGSTFTKVTAVDLSRAEVLGRSQAPSTVLTDVREGLLQGLTSLHQRHALFNAVPKDLSVLDGKLVLASSSAAGGLRIVVVGNVPGLTVEAASQAALGAGAKIVGSSAFKLTGAKIKEVEALKPDMILLTGGVDGGDSETILHNARALAQTNLAMPIVVGGNRAAVDEVVGILKHAGEEVRVVDNVMPTAGKTAVESAREAIRELFMERITQAKGLDALRGIVPVVLPTPMAVIQGVRLGADGTADKKGWGDMLLVDVGGATTDVHSIGYGHPAGENVIAQGLAEPYAKRTVEGDLGIRFNAATIVARVGLEKLTADLSQDFANFSVPREQLGDYIEQVGQDTGRVPQEPWHLAADAVLARAAVDLAVDRHVGRRERIVAREGEAWVHYGKDMRDIHTLIGTGGVFVHNAHAAYILTQRPNHDDRVQPLRPRDPKKFLDGSYQLYAIGLLSESHPDVALKLFQRYVT